jgi:hypothetical protein
VALTSAPEETPMPEPTPPQPRGSSTRFWPWLLVLVGALVVGVLLAWRPWAARPSTAAEPEPTATAAPAPTATTPGGAAPVSGTAGRFDAGTADTLLLTEDELAQAVPMAAGMSVVPAEDATWGLPAGSRVSPPECTPAVTVVEAEPDVYRLGYASGDEVTVVQSVVVLADAHAASTAFDLLVGTLETCDDYQQTNPGTDGGGWTAEAPATDRGAVPSATRRLVLTAEGAVSPEVEVTVLAANALVTTTVSGVRPNVEPADPEVLTQVARASAARALAGLEP